MAVVDMLITRTRGSRGHDLQRHAVGVGDDLIGNFATVDRDIARKLKGDANAVTLDRRDTNHTDGILGVPDDYFFAFPARNDQHPCFPRPDGYEPRRSTEEQA